MCSLCTGGAIIVTVFVYIQQFKGWNRGFATGAGVMGLAVIVFIAGMPRYRLTTVQGGFEGGGGGSAGCRGRLRCYLGRAGVGKRRVGPPGLNRLAL